ncbi:hypothetical protein G6F35_012078 [Rhizopus arrhizus]|nr:hypothetical protein G6F35_012078 [Rhizopus arrhizus]
MAAERGDLADAPGRVSERPHRLRLRPASAGHGTAQHQRRHPARSLHGRTRPGRVQDGTLFRRILVRARLQQPIETAPQPVLRQREERLQLHRHLAVDARSAQDCRPRLLTPPGQIVGAVRRYVAAIPDPHRCRRPHVAGRAGLLDATAREQALFPDAGQP